MDKRGMSTNQLIFVFVAVIIASMAIVGLVSYQNQIATLTVLQAGQKPLTQTGLISTTSSTYLDTTPVRGMFSDVTGISTYENATLTNFTASGQDRPFALKIVLTGKVSGFTLSMDKQTGNLKDNVTLDGVELVDWEDATNVLQKYPQTISNNIAYTTTDGEVLGNRMIVVLKGKVHSTYIAGNAGTEKIYAGTIGVTSYGAEGTNTVKTISTALYGASYTG